MPETVVTSRVRIDAEGRAWISRANRRVIEVVLAAAIAEARWRKS